MKCKYCGVEIGNSLKCHLCGHKQIGKTTCPVCSKLIYPYQEYCSNCGSPTIYRKDHTIKKVTPDTIVHSEQSHNYNTVSESYDYKKNAYDFKDSFKQLKDLNSMNYKEAFKKFQNQPRKNQPRNYDLLLNMTTVIKAIHEKKNIYFKYVSYEIKRNKFVEIAHNHGNHKENNEFYIISPYKLIQRDSKYYVLGYFNQRPDKLSIYRLDRMRLVRNHKSPFEEGEQFDLEQEVDHINMYVSGQKDTLEISFDEVVLREVIDQFGQNHPVKKDFENRYHLTIEDVLISDGLIGWLMMLQDHVKVIKPYSLQEEMKKRIEKMFIQYK